MPQGAPRGPMHHEDFADLICVRPYNRKGKKESFVYSSVYLCNILTKTFLLENYMMMTPYKKFSPPLLRHISISYLSKTRVRSHRLNRCISYKKKLKIKAPIVLKPFWKKTAWDQIIDSCKPANLFSVVISGSRKKFGNCFLWTWGVFNGYEKNLFNSCWICGKILFTASFKRFFP